MERISGIDVHQLVVLILMAMACTIWWVMSWSGVPIGMTLIIIATRHYVILKVPAQVSGVFCGVVLGSALRLTTLRSPCALLAASTSILNVGMATTVFDVCQDSIRSALCNLRYLPFYHCLSILYLS